MKLVAVPNHEWMESPSSWLTRIALRQVVSPLELARHFNLNIRVDCEMALGRSSLENMAARFKKLSKSIPMMDSMMGRLRTIDPNGERFLLRKRSLAYHRFCAACLATDRVKYFRIEWRFKGWRWCPIHACLLHEQCPHCGKVVQLPSDMFTAGPDGLGVATLDRCLHCAESLTDGWKTSLDTLGDDVVTPWEQILLDNGRATLATLATGKLKIQGNADTYGFRQLKKIERLGYLPHVNFRLTYEELLRRQFEAADKRL
ncbi:TniQ family protein [Paracidovorax avenae]|uniref:TniQ family protein n=1 Tax=Paracidovorax avenae TaxID=80867 RepID=UPI001AD83686|nr:TniQ family protein [Paracidovorax avenae]